MVRDMHENGRAEHHGAAFYRTASGTEPVREFLERLPPRHRDALRRQIHHACLILDATGFDPAFPRTSHVRGPIRELRCHFGRTLYRILYGRSGRLLILLHVFEKRRRTIAPADIDCAIARWLDFEQRSRTEES